MFVSSSNLLLSTGSSTGGVEMQGADSPDQEQSAAAAPDKGLLGQQPSSDEEEKGFGANEEGEPSGEQSLQKWGVKRVLIEP